MLKFLDFAPLLGGHAMCLSVLLVIFFRFLLFFCLPHAHFHSKKKKKRKKHVIHHHASCGHRLRFFCKIVEVQTSHNFLLFPAKSCKIDNTTFQPGNSGLLQVSCFCLLVVSSSPFCNCVSLLRFLVPECKTFF